MLKYTVVPLYVSLFYFQFIYMCNIQNINLVHIYYELTSFTKTPHCSVVILSEDKLLHSSWSTSPSLFRPGIEQPTFCSAADTQIPSSPFLVDFCTVGLVFAASGVWPPAGHQRECRFKTLGRWIHFSHTELQIDIYMNASTFIWKTFMSLHTQKWVYWDYLACVTNVCHWNTTQQKVQCWINSHRVNFNTFSGFI